MKTNPRLDRLAAKVTTLSEFLTAIKTWPNWYLPTMEFKRMTRPEFERIYNSVKEVL